jgi:hypothetical protein
VIWDVTELVAVTPDAILIAEVLFAVPVVVTVKVEVETPALALNNFENDAVSPEKVPLNVALPPTVKAEAEMPVEKD